MRMTAQMDTTKMAGEDVQVQMEKRQSVHHLVYPTTMDDVPIRIQMDMSAQYDHHQTDLGDVRRLE